MSLLVLGETICPLCGKKIEGGQLAVGFPAPVIGVIAIACSPSCRSFSSMDLAEVVQRGQSITLAGPFTSPLRRTRMRLLMCRDPHQGQEVLAFPSAGPSSHTRGFDGCIQQANISGDMPSM